MSPPKKMKATKKIINPQIILRVVAFTPIAKPLNGALPQSNTSHFLRLYPVTYTYVNNKTEKTATSETYLIKGLRGAIRHQIMHLCSRIGLEVCHTSDKEYDKQGHSLLPEGFHLLGACRTNGECVVHQIFGSKGVKSLIAVSADPITSISQKSATTEEPVQNVHIATEKRICLSFDDKSIQDFGERYFSGYFTFEIDVTKCNSIRLGLLIEAIVNLEKLGRGFNTGYGRLKIKQFQLLERSISRTPVWNGDSFLVEEHVVEKSLKTEVVNAMEAWTQYATLNT
ncbi:MAG: RAMP superfamily CRISPR-associated protein [Candidatus Hodarchaeota archaeon]